MLVKVYTCQTATLIEITCRSSLLLLIIIVGLTAIGVSPDHDCICTKSVM